MDGVPVSLVLGGVKPEQGAEERLFPGHRRHGVIQALLQSCDLIRSRRSGTEQERHENEEEKKKTKKKNNDLGRF